MKCQRSFRNMLKFFFFSDCCQQTTNKSTKELKNVEQNSIKVQNNRLIGNCQRKFPNLLTINDDTDRMRNTN